MCLLFKIKVIVFNAMDIINLDIYYFVSPLLFIIHNAYNCAF